MGLDDFEIDPATITIAGILYLFCMVVLWKFGSTMGDWRTMDRIIISVVAAPVLYLCVHYQMNK